jgi:DNA-directed RNA polymerase subunit RPC12/RpoP
MMGIITAPARGSEMTDEKVVFLAFSNPKMDDGTLTLRACATCKNKTFLVVHDMTSGFPALRCAACSSHLGRIGWASEEDDAT